MTINEHLEDETLDDKTLEILLEEEERHFSTEEELIES